MEVNYLDLVGEGYMRSMHACMRDKHTWSVRKVSSHYEYLENRSRSLDVTWQPVRGDLTVHP